MEMLLSWHFSVHSKATIYLLGSESGTWIEKLSVTKALVLHCPVGTLKQKTRAVTIQSPRSDELLSINLDQTTPAFNAESNLMFVLLGCLIRLDSVKPDSYKVPELKT